MSGGALDYVYSRLEDIVPLIPGDTPERRAFKKHLIVVARALKAIEWNMSGDGDDEEPALIRRLIGFKGIIASEVEEAKVVVIQLQDLLTRAKNEFTQD